MVGAQPQPTRKMLLGGELADIHADLTQDHQRRVSLDPLDGRQIHAHRSEHRLGRFKPQGVRFAMALFHLGLQLGTGRPVRSLASACSICPSHSVTFI